MTKQQKQMRRWSGEKLEKELMFAVECNDGGRECMRWLTDIADEKVRRQFTYTKRS